MRVNRKDRRTERAATALPLVAFLAVVLVMVSPVAAQALCRDDMVELRGDWGSARFSVEIADTDETRAQGLMHRESLPRSGGMLFVYDQPTRAVFWMRNTLIPLDMIFVDPRGVVRHVHHEAIPHDETPIDGGSGIQMVLEINGGLAGALGIAAGSEMRHPRVDRDQAVWPCPQD